MTGTWLPEAISVGAGPCSWCSEECTCLVQGAIVCEQLQVPLACISSTWTLLFGLVALPFFCVGSLLRRIQRARSHSD